MSTGMLILFYADLDCIVVNLYVLF